MIILVWIVAVFFIIVVGGEIRYRFFERKKIIHENQVISVNWKESVDIDLDKLSMEQSVEDFIPSKQIAMRGSWRLAQNQVMSRQIFSFMRDEEYRKRL